MVINLLLLLFFFFLRVLIEMQKKEMASQADLSTAANDKSASVSSVPASWSSRTKRKSKKCKKCGSMVQNLSCHQSDVHKMPMMKRKRNVYVTREEGSCPIKG